jgi:hypothetical protein
MRLEKSQHKYPSIDFKYFGKYLTIDFQYSGKYLSIDFMYFGKYQKYLLWKITLYSLLSII